MTHDPSQPREEDIVRGLRTPLAVVDGDLGLHHHNPAFSRLFGLAPDTPDGAPLFDVVPDLAGHADVVSRLVTRAGDSDSEENEAEIEVRSGVGPRRTLLLAADGLRSSGFALLTFHDVSDRRRLEREARRYRVELERSNRELQDFAHAASHDLQEPLRKIRTYASRLPALLKLDATDEKALRYLKRIEEAGERLQERTEALLQLARIGRTRPEPEMVDLGAIVREVLGDMGLRIRETEARVQLNDLPTLEADPVQMRVLFQNLIANALKFHQEGVKPVMRIGLDHVETPGNGGPAQYVVAIEDEGVGFEEEYAEKIFEPFQRLHGRTEYGGSGIGLAVCRRVVENHHGTISAESPPGRGARFSMTLPSTQPRGYHE